MIKIVVSVSVTDELLMVRHMKFFMVWNFKRLWISDKTFWQKNANMD